MTNFRAADLSSKDVAKPVRNIKGSKSQRSSGQPKACHGEGKREASARTKQLASFRVVAEPIIALISEPSCGSYSARVSGFACWNFEVGTGRCFCRHQNWAHLGGSNQFGAAHELTSQSSAIEHVIVW